MSLPSWVVLHGMVTHFPIALLILALVIDLGSYLQRDSPEKQRVWRQFSLTLLGVAAVTSLPSLLTGYFTGLGYPRPKPEFQAHWIAAVVSTVLALVVLLWRLTVRDNLSAQSRVLAMLGTAGAATAVGWTGHLGGAMVFGNNAPEVAVVSPTPSPTANLTDEKLKLFADRMGLAAEKMALSMRKIESGGKPAAVNPAKPAPPSKVPPATPPVTPAASSTASVDRAIDKLDQVSNQYLAIAEKLDRAVDRMDKLSMRAVSATAAAPSASTAEKSPGSPPAKPATQATTPATGPSPELIATGKRLYFDPDVGGCDSCHKIAGSGGRGGPALDGSGIRRPSMDWHVQHLIDPPSKVPGSKMPAYNDLTQEQLQALAAYMVSLK